MRKYICGLIFLLFGLALLIYLGGVWFFSGHFLPGSSFGEMDVSFQDEEKVKELVEAKARGYSLTILEMEESLEVIKAEDAGLKFADDQSIAGYLDQQNPWKWMLSLGGKKTYSLSEVTTYKKKKLKASIKNLNCLQNMVAPQDAYLEEKDEIYTVVPEVTGNTLDQKKVIRVVKEAFEAGKSQVDLVQEDCYLTPSITDQDGHLTENAEELNKMLGVTIYYDFGDREEVVDKDLIQTWLMLETDGTYELSQDAIVDYVGNLADTYDTYGGTRQFVTATGQEITLTGGDYGYVIKQDETAKELRSAILEGESGTREPVYLYAGGSRNSNDIGNTYVEICLSSQTLYFYKDGSLLVETPVVTGNPLKGNSTPTGVYTLDDKQSPGVLKGEDYETNVTYWMPFNGKIGIHDCGTWRTEFGEDVYLTEGSHGCVNVPYDQAEIIYKNIEVGTPIIVYEGE